MLGVREYIYIYIYREREREREREIGFLVILAKLSRSGIAKTQTYFGFYFKNPDSTLLFIGLGQAEYL